MTSRLPPEDLARLLAKTSRTFALAIPLLEEPLATQVGIAYLLFRIADELEDAPLWQRDRREHALVSFARWLDDAEAPEWKRLVAEQAPTSSEGCLELLARADDVRAAARSFAPEVAGAMLAHTKRTALGMAEFVARQDERGGLVLESVEDLQRYAYVVAGIVGELLTDLFAFADAGVARVRGALDAEARAFGEGLQLVNILKDAAADACEGRAYVPRDVPRAEIFALARHDLERAARYVETLASANAPRGVITFCDLPVRLAVATLDRLEQGAPKLGRDEVMQIYAAVTARPA